MRQQPILGILEILLHLSSAVICLGILIASAVAFSTIAEIDLFDDDIPDDTDSGEDRDRFKAVAGYVLSASIVGIVTQLLLAAHRGFYYCKVMQPPFYMLKVLCFICNIILALGLISGATALLGNARDINDDYIDEANCDEVQVVSDRSPEVDEAKEQCDYFEQLRDSQAAAAALCFIQTAICVVLTAIVLLSTVQRKEVPASITEELPSETEALPRRIESTV